jgi:hypothetical protein
MRRFSRWKTVIVTAFKGQTMNRHTMHYIDLNPEPVQEPSDGLIFAGAVALVVALACVILFAFSL